MAKPIREYSAEQVGKVWRVEDHVYLCRMLQEIERTYQEMQRQAVAEAAKEKQC